MSFLNSFSFSVLELILMVVVATISGLWALFSYFDQKSLSRNKILIEEFGRFKSNAKTLHLIRTGKRDGIDRHPDLLDQDMRYSMKKMELFLHRNSKVSEFRTVGFKLIEVAYSGGSDFSDTYQKFDLIAHKLLSN